MGYEEDWQKRVIDEKIELDKKIEKIREFMGSDKYDELEKIDRFMIHKQWTYMKYYSEVLNDRIGRFKEEK